MKPIISTSIAAMTATIALMFGTIAFGQGQGGAKGLLGDGKARIYRIKEITSGHYVAVGSNGNILRWVATGGDEQKWLIYPQANEDGRYKTDDQKVVKYRIENIRSGKFMAINPTGNAIEWDKLEDGGQLFVFNNYDDTSYNIQINDGPNRLAVGGDGNIFRWGPTKTDEQRFALEEMEVVEPPAPAQAEMAPNTIPDPPKPKNIQENPPSKTEPILVGEDIYSFAWVVDQDVPDKEQQFKRYPYYAISHKQYWDYGKDRGATIQVPVQGTQEYTLETKVGYEETDIKSIKKIVGFTLNAELEQTAKVQVGDEKGGASLERRMKIGAEYRNQTEDINTTSKSGRGETIKIQKFTYPGWDKPYKVFYWSLVDLFQLYRIGQDGKREEKPIRSWENVNGSASRTYVYPEGAPEPRL